MKKAIIIIMSLLLFAGVGFLGYTIFFSKNIESVEYEGSVQTLYLVDECSTPKFGDGKLKVTYKGGSIKYISIAEAYADENIEVKDFSTSTQDKRIMKLNYKNHIIEIEYHVIKSGMYYVNSHKRINGNTTSLNNSYTLKQSGEIFEFLNNGGFKYYTKKAGTTADWYLYDGANINSYKYEIVGNTLKIYLGSDEPAYNVTTSVKNGEFEISAVKSKFNTEGMETSRDIKGLKYIEKKTNAVVSSSALAYENNSFVKTDDEEYFKFYVNEKFADRRGDIFLKLVYTTPLISLDSETSSQAIMQTLYVIADDSMVKGKALETKDRWDYDKWVILWYEGIDFELTYQVKVKN